MTTVSHALPRAGAWRRLGQRALYWLPAVVVFALGIAAWQWLLPDVLHIQSFLLPRFSAVMSTFWNERDTLWSKGSSAAWITFKDALAGFGLGSSFAVLTALALARWRPLGTALMPYMVAANAIPIIAFAPITSAWFGPLSPWPNIVIAAVLCYFPVAVNTLRGLTSVHPESIELMHSYAASQTDIFRRVRIPTSLPFVFTALKVASVLAMIGAVVADYFGGSTTALGALIQNSVALARYETAWAAILVASILGIAFYATIAIVERFVLRWHPSAGRVE